MASANMPIIMIAYLLTLGGGVARFFLLPELPVLNDIHIAIANVVTAAIAAKLVPPSAACMLLVAAIITMVVTVTLDATAIVLWCKYSSLTNAGRLLGRCPIC